MSVSRETFLNKLKQVVGGDQHGGFKLGEIDLLPFLLVRDRPTCLVVDAHVFKSVFSFLFKSLSSDFVVYTNREDDGPIGFSSALDKYKNTFSCTGKGGEVVLVDRHTYRNGSVSVYGSSESFFVDSGCNRGSLLAALERANYSRVDIVSSPGEFASRGGRL